MKLLRAYYGTRHIVAGYLGTKPLNITGGITELLSSIPPIDINSNVSAIAVLSRMFDNISFDDTVSANDTSQFILVSSQAKHVKSDIRANINDNSNIVTIIIAPEKVSLEHDSKNISDTQSLTLSKLTVHSLSTEDNAKELDTSNINVNPVIIKKFDSAQGGTVQDTSNIVIIVHRAIVLESSESTVVNDRSKMNLHTVQNSNASQKLTDVGIVETSQFNSEAVKISKIGDSVLLSDILSFNNGNISVAIVCNLSDGQDVSRCDSLFSGNVNSVYFTDAKASEDINIGSTGSMIVRANYPVEVLCEDNIVFISDADHTELICLGALNIIVGTDKIDVGSEFQSYFTIVWSYKKEGFVCVPRAISVTTSQSNDFITID